MKKVVLLISLFLMTGCFGEVGHGIITKECSKSLTANDMSVDTKVTLKSKEGNIESLRIVETYNGHDLTSILNSKKSEANMYVREDSVSINIDGSVITYDIDVTSSSEFVKDRFNIKQESHKMIKYYEENGYTCK